MCCCTLLLLSLLFRVMASATLIAQVLDRIQETDGGLEACFATDLVGYFTASGYDKEAKNVRDEVRT